MNKDNRASNSKFLEERIKQNEKNQSLDLNKWAFSKIKKSNKKIKILELCCGTGRQTKFLNDWFPNSKIHALDISKESLNQITQQKFYDSKKLKLINSDLDSFFLSNNEIYDIIFVSYGLYYAKNVNQVINDIFKSLKTQGDFIVLGPYGENNEKLFSFLEKSGQKINDFVRFSSSEFMTKTLLNHSLGKSSKIVIHTSINTIKWTSINDIIEYWKNSTFYNEDYLDQVKSNMILEFNKSNYFKIEKHIMLLKIKKK